MLSKEIPKRKIQINMMSLLPFNMNIANPERVRHSHTGVKEVVLQNTIVSQLKKCVDTEKCPAYVNSKYGK